jgi:type I restriction enzyme S subunit
LVPRFLFYGINAHLNAIEEVTGYTTVKHLSSKQILGIEMLIPPHDEQRRIVAILDEAFEGITTAKANAAKNLQSARELFDSKLDAILANGGVGWLEAPIAECFKVKSGDFLPAKIMVTAGGIPVYGGNGVAGSHDQSNLDGDQIVIGRVGAKCGNVRYVSGEIWLTDNAFHISTYLKAFDPPFLARLLNHKDLRRTANQAAQPVISYTTIKDLELSFPLDVNEQRRIAAHLDELEAEVERLASVLQRKLAALDELKQSLLHQAFSGQLTARQADRTVAADV